MATVIPLLPMAPVVVVTAPFMDAISERTTAALKKFEVGKKAFDAADFETALLAFQSSAELSPSPNSLLYIGRCFRALGKTASAYTSYRLAARMAQDRIAATGEKRYGATRDAANTEAAEIEAKVARVTIAVPSGVRPGFVVLRNGEEVPPAAWGVAVESDPGDVVIQSKGPHTVPFEERFQLVEGEQHRVDVKADRIPSAMLTVTLKTRPSGIAIDLDGEPLDPSAAIEREVNVGHHKVTAHAPGYLPFSWDEAVTDGAKTTVVVDVKPDVHAPGRESAGTPKWLFFTAAGAAVATVAVGSVIAIRAKSSQDDELAKAPLARDPDTRDSIRTESALANTLFIAGGALAVGAGVLAFTTKWKKETPRESSLIVAPWGTSTAGGLGAMGRF